MFDELAERPLMTPLAGTKHAYVRLAIEIFSQSNKRYIKLFHTIQFVEKQILLLIPPATLTTKIRTSYASIIKISELFKTRTLYTIKNAM